MSIRFKETEQILKDSLKVTTIDWWTSLYSSRGINTAA
jgi:hypothetical protein